MRYGMIALACVFAHAASAASWDERRIAGLEKRFGAEEAERLRAAGIEAADAVAAAGHPCTVISSVVVVDGVADRIVLCDDEHLYEYSPEAAAVRQVAREEAPELLRGKYSKH